MAASPSRCASVQASATIVALLVAGALPAFAALVPTIYGQDYTGVPQVMLALGIAGGFLIFSGPVQAFVQARLSGVRLLWVNLVALVVNIALALSLIPILGVWGAVIANIGAAATQLGILLAGEIRTLGVTWAATAHSLLPAAVGAAACLGSWFATQALGWGAAPTAVAAGTLGLVLVILGLRATRSGLDETDAQAIQGSLPSRLSTLTRPLLRLCTQPRR